MEYENWRKAKTFHSKAGEHFVVTGFNSVVTVAIYMKKIYTTKEIYKQELLGRSEEE